MLDIFILLAVLLAYPPVGLVLLALYISYIIIGNILEGVIQWFHTLIK